jgi:hypothetical protein
MNFRLPTYSYVPGGPWPHPGREAERLNTPKPVAIAIEDDDWSRSPLYLRGVALFNGGYYWEAHEAWEYLWHAHHRRGPTADVLKGLIKLGAAGVKVRERQPHGVRIHASRAAELFQSVAREHGPRLLGLDLNDLVRTAARIAAAPPDDPNTIEDAVSIVFDFRIEPTS